MKALTHWQNYLGWTKYLFTILTDDVLATQLCTSKCICVTAHATGGMGRVTDGMQKGMPATTSVGQTT